MKIPFVGPSYTARSLNADAQRSVNCYLEMDNASPRAPIALYGTPGLVLQTTLSAGPVRGCIVSTDGFWYFVSGNHVYKVDPAYTATDLGAIGTSVGRVGLATNGAEILIVDGNAGWLVSSGVMAQIVDPDFPNGVTVATCIDGYFIVTGDGSQRFYWNETPNVGSGWNGLDFASVEGSPDQTIACLADHRELWFIGRDSAEIFINTGDAAAPFQRSGNSFIDQGTTSAWTVAALDNSVFWLSSGKNGNGIVFRAQGYTPVRVSNHALEEALSNYTTIADAYAYAWATKGHLFYVLTFPTADATWMYDVASSQWFEWAWRDPATDLFHRHRSSCHGFNNGVHLVGDWENGKLYTLSFEVQTDNGDPIKFLRRTQTMNEEGARLFFQELEVDMETGVTGTPDPQVMLRYSNDGGHTWSNERTRSLSLGAVGEYDKRVKFGPTGSARNRVWELSITDPVKRAVFGAWARVEKGT